MFFSCFLSIVHPIWGTIGLQRSASPRLGRPSWPRSPKERSARRGLWRMRSRRRQLTCGWCLVVEPCGCKSKKTRKNDQSWTSWDFLSQDKLGDEEDEKREEKLGHYFNVLQKWEDAMRYRCNLDESNDEWTLLTDVQPDECRLRTRSSSDGSDAASEQVRVVSRVSKWGDSCIILINGTFEHLWANSIKILIKISQQTATQMQSIIKSLKEKQVIQKCLQIKHIKSCQCFNLKWKVLGKMRERLHSSNVLSGDSSRDLRDCARGGTTRGGTAREGTTRGGTTRWGTTRRGTSQELRGCPCPARSDMINVWISAPKSDESPYIHGQTSN